MRFPQCLWIVVAVALVPQISAAAQPTPAKPHARQAVAAAKPSATLVSQQPATPVAPVHAAGPVDLGGCWSGYWISCTSGHEGPLTARFCKINDQKYRVEFRGRFFKIIPFRYSVTLNVVTNQDGKATLAGDSYLGRRYGTFHYQASADGKKFVANYTSCKDDGRFVLCRTCP